MKKSVDEYIVISKKIRNLLENENCEFEEGTYICLSTAMVFAKSSRFTNEHLKQIFQEYLKEYSFAPTMDEVLQKIKEENG